MYLNLQERVLYLKIIYYGMGLCGKTTSLQAIHQMTDPEQRSELIALKTKGDRTLFFDLLPIDLGVVNGLSVRAKVFTVPGQVQYEITRRQVLSRADGVVFVADSQRAQADGNRAMIVELGSFLREHGLDPMTIPLVMQWNKRDLPDLIPVERLERELNQRGVDSFETVATTGQGVLDAFQRILTLTLGQMCRNRKALSDRIDDEAITTVIAKTFAGFRRSAPAIPFPGEQSRYLTVDTQAFAEGRSQGPNDPLRLDELLASSISTSEEMADGLAQTRVLEKRVGLLEAQARALAKLARELADSSDTDRPFSATLQAGLAGTGFRFGSALGITTPGEPLAQKAIIGMEKDPLNGVGIPSLGSMARCLAEKGEPVLSHNPQAELFHGQPHPVMANVRSVLAVPVHAPGTCLGLLAIYVHEGERDPDDEDLLFLTTVGDMAAVALVRNVLGRRARLKKGA